MKKIISCLLLVVMLLSATVCPASALSLTDSWVLSQDAKTITHSDKTYTRLDFLHQMQVACNHDCESVNLQFADFETQKLYNGSFITCTVYEERFVEVELFRNSGYVGTFIYVEKSYYDEFLSLKDGIANSYSVKNDYDISREISKKDYDKWCNGTAIKMSAYELNDYNQYSIYTQSSQKTLLCECGLIFHDYYTDEVYLVRYSDYDRTYFYSDGSLATDHEEEVTVYVLEDEKLKAELLELFDQLPEDELDWLVSDEPETGVILVFSIIVFGIIPLALIVFSMVMLFVIKDKKYRAPFIFIIIGSVMVIISLIVIANLI